MRNERLQSTSASSQDVLDSGASVSNASDERMQSVGGRFIVHSGDEGGRVVFRTGNEGGRVISQSGLATYTPRSRDSSPIVREYGCSPNSEEAGRWARIQEDRRGHPLVIRVATSSEASVYDEANVAVRLAHEETPVEPVNSATSNWSFAKGWHDLDGADEVLACGPLRGSNFGQIARRAHEHSESEEARWLAQIKRTSSKMRPKYRTQFLDRIVDCKTAEPDPSPEGEPHVECDGGCEYRNAQGANSYVLVLECRKCGHRRKERRDDARCLHKHE